MSGLALLFPGQGAQTVGMGRDVFDRYSAARQAFAEASAAVGVDMEKVCFEGPEEDLNRTDLCQPAVLTVSIAVLRALEQEFGRRPAAVAAAGLSLGEYGALVAAGALGFQDAVRLVYARGRYMQDACEASPGAMYSVIGLADAQVEEACRTVRRQGGGVWPANYNSPGQLVISGEEQAAKRAADLCVETGARRTLRLNVAGAFHSPLMQPAAGRLAEMLRQTRFSAPRFDVIANVTAEPVGSPDQIGGLLTRQVTSPVRWADSMRRCIALGARGFVEVGPGRVLRGLLKRIAPSMACRSVGNVEEVCAAAAAL